MKLTFVAWLFIVCGHAISNMAFEEKPTSKVEDFSHSVTAVNGQVHGSAGNGEDRIKEYKNEVFQSIKTKRGGSGSPNIVRRPNPKQRNAATVTVTKPNLFVRYVSLALFFMFSPILPLYWRIRL